MLGRHRAAGHGERAHVRQLLRPRGHPGAGRTKIRFPNEGRSPHNAVAVDGTWRTPDRVGADQAATVVLERPGVYRFYCSFHATRDGRQGMAATLVVGDVPYYPGQEVGAGPALRPVARASGTVRRVPEDHRTIQAAVAAARPGDLVLVGPGVYWEEVKVKNIGLCSSPPKIATL